MPDRLHFTGDDEADALLAQEPMALLIGFALDQQVTVPTAFTGPLKLKQRIGRSTQAGSRRPTRRVRSRVPGEARDPPLPGEHGAGPGSRRIRRGPVRRRANGSGRGGRSKDLGARIGELPGFGEMKIKALGSVLAKRFGVAAAQGLVPRHPTLGDVDSAEALASYQEAKRAYKKALEEEVRQRVLAYVTRERNGAKELLVFDHGTSEAGTQVPAGRSTRAKRSRSASSESWTRRRPSRGGSSASSAGRRGRPSTKTTHSRYADRG